MRRALIGAALAGIAVLPGCGSAQQHDTVPARDVIAAATTTEQTHSERLYQDLAVTAQGISAHVKSDGVYDNRRHMGKSSFDMSDFVTKSGLGKPELGRGEALNVSATLGYIRMPWITNLAGSDKPWIKVDLQTIGAQGGIDMKSLVGTGSNDPSHALETLKAATGDVEVIGSETVRAAPTNHYRAVIDFRRQAQLQPPSKRAAAVRSVDRIVQLGFSRYNPTDIWIDPADKTVRRMTTHFSGKIQGHKVSYAQTLEMWDFGVTVPTVEAPPADQSVDFTDAISQLQSSTP